MRGKAPENSEIGFSTVELLIISIVILIVAVFSIPMIQQTLSNYRLDTGTSLLSSELSYARMEAIKRNREVRVMIENSNRRVTIKTTNLTGGEIILRGPTQLPTGIVFDGTPPASVDFTSLGRNKFNGNTVVRLKIVNRATNKAITVSATGNIK